MEESPQATLEHKPLRIPVETAAQTLERCSAIPRSLWFDDQSNDTTDTVVGMMVGYKFQGSLDWAPQSFEPDISEYSLVTADSDQDTIKIAQQGAEAFHKRDETIARQSKWWDRDGFHDIRDDVENNLTEAFRISMGEKGIDLLNLSGEQISEEEHLKILETVKVVSEWTKGRVFSSVRGIVLRSADKFDDQSAGIFNHAYGVVAINIDDIRSALDEPSKRYEPYFKDGNMSKLKLILAHELGHGLDNYDIMGPDPNISHFNDKFGWQDVVEPYSGDFERPSELEPITDYAGKNPAEDFAETFAIVAMGGDTSLFPNRAKVMQEFIESKNREVPGGNTAKITVEKLEQLSPKLPTAINLKAYL